MHRGIKIGVAIIGLGTLALAIFHDPKKAKYTYGNNGVISSTGQVFDAKSIADKLEQAMLQNASIWDIFNPTDEETIYKLLAPLSGSQFYQVIQSFGKRKYNKITGDDTFAIFSYSLPEWLKSDLTAAEYSVLKSKFSNYL